MNIIYYGRTQVGGWDSSWEKEKGRKTGNLTNATSQAMKYLQQKS
jgi:hypothetical protein